MANRNDIVVCFFDLDKMGTMLVEDQHRDPLPICWIFNVPSAGHLNAIAATSKH